MTIDHKEAVKWFRKAAEKGAPAAQIRLGDCYIEGTGVEQSKTKAIIWYKAAADQGDNDAKEILKRINA